MKNIFISVIIALFVSVGYVSVAEAGISFGTSTTEASASSGTQNINAINAELEDTNLNNVGSDFSESNSEKLNDTNFAESGDQASDDASSDVGYEGDSDDSSSGFTSSKLITSEQLNQYESGLKYLSCAYQGKENNCYGAVSIQDARKIVMELKELEATGLNASKKDGLDSKAEDLLLYISVDEAKDFIKNLGSLSESAFIDEMIDGGVITSQIKMPGVEAMDLIAENQFGQAASKSGDSVSATITKTKEEMKDLISANSDSGNNYTSEVEYLKGVKFDTEKSAEEQYKSLELGKLIEHVLTHVSEVNAMSTNETSTTITSLRRYKEHGYAIKIESAYFKYDSEVDKDVYSKEKRPVIEAKADFDIKDRTIDAGWINRYEDMEQEDLKQRNYDSTYFVLDYGVTKAERLYAKAAAEEDAEYKAKLVKEAEDYYNSVREYYVKMSKYDDEKARSLCLRYNTINRSGM
ncbi:MAG TPA: hypothetical protein DCL21_04355 [Alphaproteobacteria bacterium]|nr:hypothetical protein [Alphaproteobacteria bacterium]